MSARDEVKARERVLQLIRSYPGSTPEELLPHLSKRATLAHLTRRTSELVACQQVRTQPDGAGLTLRYWAVS